MDSIKQSFVFESREQKQQLKCHLLQMVNGEGNLETNNAIFQCALKIYRYALSAKYESDSLKCEFILEFMYVMVNVLNELRSEAFNADQELVGLLLACSDHLGVLTDCVENENVPDDIQNVLSRLLLDRLQSYLDNR